MTTCRDIAELLALHAGADLEADEEARVREHVTSCVECARELEDYRLSLSALKEVRSSGPAPSLWGGLSGVLRESAPARVIAFPLWAACAAVVLVGLSIGLLVESVLPDAGVRQDVPEAVAADQPVKVQPTAVPVRSENVSTGGEESERRPSDRRYHLQRGQPPSRDEGHRVRF